MRGDRDPQFGKQMRILYVAMKYDYGYPERGYSFEHANFYDSLARMGHEIIYFDFMSLYKELGRERMNRRLWEVAQSEKPDLLFCVLFRDELDKAVMSRISEETDTVTVNWFCDDHWRFEDFSRHWAPCFNWVVTTAKSAQPKYARLGYKNVIKSQWACNHFSYRNLELPFKYEVTFVGQPHGNRREIIEALRKAGIDVKAWGHGWESGRLSQEQMIEVFNQSRINLNLANASLQTGRLARWRRRLEKRWPLLGGIRGRLMRYLPKLPLEFPWKRKYYSQIKGRNFEIPGCGGFLLTDYADNLEEYYEIGKEIVCFENNRDLIEKIRYYLVHDEERRAIAEAGYQRTLREHTYQQRFNEIFARTGLALTRIAPSEYG